MANREAGLQLILKQAMDYAWIGLCIGMIKAGPGTSFCIHIRSIICCVGALLAALLLFKLPQTRYEIFQLLYCAQWIGACLPHTRDHIATRF
jgi:hypothetical protein